MLKGVCYLVPLARIFESFQELARPRQLFIRQPDVCALVYAKNEKRGSYTGFFHNIHSNGYLSVDQFLAVHALPGPNSVITCLTK